MTTARARDMRRDESRGSWTAIGVVRGSKDREATRAISPTGSLTFDARLVPFIFAVANLPALGLPVTFLVHVATFGIGEETAWRGFALPRMQAHHDAQRAARWGIWRIPSFFGNPASCSCARWR